MPVGITPSITTLVGNTSIALRTSKQPEDEKLLDACQQFEAYFLANIMKEMRSSLPSDGIIPRSEGEKTFQEMLDGEYAAQMSRTNSVGLASVLYSQLAQPIP